MATNLRKPDGLIVITPDNLDMYLAKLQLTDLTGIASANEKRLKMIGIKTPLEMRHAPSTLLRKAFGGIVGDYWHRRLNFGEVDLYSNDMRTMSAMRTVSRQQRENRQLLESMLISLCTRLEQRMVKQGVFCKQVSFFIKYKDSTGWDTVVKLADPVQDGMELRSYILEQISKFQKTRNIETVFSDKVQSMGVAIAGFVSDKVLQYSLFDNRLKKDVLRKVMYKIKDQYGKNLVRKGGELFAPNVMKDAIGFGSVKDMVVKDGEVRNKYLLEEDY
jgi:DNA polymerase-4